MAAAAVAVESTACRKLSVTTVYVVQVRPKAGARTPYDCSFQRMVVGVGLYLHCRARNVLLKELLKKLPTGAFEVHHPSSSGFVERLRACRKVREMRRTSSIAKVKL